MVLGRRADHGRAADIDVLDAVVIGLAGLQRLLERVEVDHEQVDSADPVGSERRLVLGVVAHREKAAMNRRMQRLHPSVHHLGKAGQLGHLFHGEARLGQRAVGAAGRDQFDAPPAQRRGEVGEPGLVRDGEKGAGDPDLVARHGNGLCRQTRNLRAR
ncbi:hypothetical protein GCM10025880_55980 [Methylorubrum aminovorans]|nr:hypothetical protein GCM10025880_55980 [Methylorubrum aminovorans]